jgi:signal transduction histidine kinase
MSQVASEAETIEYRMRHRSGHVVWVRDDGIVVRDQDGKPYFRGILADITLEKEAEGALESLNEDLERRVTARTAELQKANEELGAAKDEAERASRAKSEFLSRASHELRTPLNAILGFGQLLEMSSLAGRDKEWVTQILKGGNNLLQLINEVLDISKVQAGNLSLSLEPVSIEESPHGRLPRSGRMPTAERSGSRCVRRANLSFSPIGKDCCRFFRSCSRTGSDSPNEGGLSGSIGPRLGRGP